MIRRQEGISGPLVINKTLVKIRKGDYWTIYKSGVKDWCASCKTCIGKRIFWKGEITAGVQYWFLL